MSAAPWSSSAPATALSSSCSPTSPAWSAPPRPPDQRRRRTRRPPSGGTPRPSLVRVLGGPDLDDVAGCQFGDLAVAGVEAPGDADPLVAGGDAADPDDPQHHRRRVRRAAGDLVAGEPEAARVRARHEAGELDRGAIEAGAVVVEGALAVLQQGHGDGLGAGTERGQDRPAGADVHLRAPVDPEAAERWRRHQQQRGDRRQQQPAHPVAASMVMPVERGHRGAGPGLPGPLRSTPLPAAGLADQRHQAEDDHRHPRDGKPRAHPDADVAAVGAGDHQPQQRGADQQADQPASGAHSSHRPTTALQTSATTSVSGANRSAKRRPKVPACKAMSFTSTIGPTTMNASRAVSENWVRLAATKASASEQIAITTASPASASSASGPAPATASRMLRGTTVWSVAAVAAPTIRNPPACSRSCCAVDTSTARGGPCSTGRRRARSSSSSRPVHAHTRPTIVEVSRLATRRATITAGRPGKATAVAVSTTGLIAGADSRNASAAAGSAPRATSRPAIGTDPHSQPGSAAPAAAATGTASAGRRGSALGRKPAGTNAATAALITTPSTRNGIACTVIATNTVAQWATAGRSRRWSSSGRSAAAATTTRATRAMPASTGRAARRWRGCSRRSRRSACIRLLSTGVASFTSLELLLTGM